nr:transposase, MuDR [Tanacetum cinerariifolium]
MRDNPQLQQDDLPILLALKYKFERLLVFDTPCIPSVIRLRDQDDPHDDAHSEEENNAKRQKTYEHGTFMFRESSSSQDFKSKPGPSTSGESACKDHLHQETKEPRKPKEVVYLNTMIFQIIKTYWELRHEHKSITEIIVRRESGSIVSITKLDYKNLNKNDIEDMYLLIVNNKVDGYSKTGVESYQQKVNHTVPTITFLGIKNYKVFSIICEPVYGIIYKNIEKEKRVMRHQKVYKFCDATLKRVFEGLKSYNNDVKHNVIEDESHFITKVVDNDLAALTMFTKHFISGVRFVVLRGRSSKESKNAYGEIGGVEKMSSTGSKFMFKGQECLEGCFGARGGEVNEGGNDFGVRKSLLGEIPKVVIGESGREVFGDDGGAVNCHEGNNDRFQYVWYENREQGFYFGRWHLYCHKGRVDVDLFSVVDLNDMLEMLGYRNSHTTKHKLIEIYYEHENSYLEVVFEERTPMTSNIEDGNDEDNDIDKDISSDMKVSINSEDSDWVDEEHIMNEVEVDLKDFFRHTDRDVEFIECNKGNIEIPIEDFVVECVDLDDFDSANESDKELEGKRKKDLRKFRKKHKKGGIVDNIAPFNVDKNFPDKETVRKLVYDHVVATRRKFYIWKNDKDRLTVVCRGKCHVFNFPEDRTSVNGPSESCLKNIRGPLKKGYKVRMRDLLRLDGCFMKGQYPGQLLVVIGVDANHGTYPLAIEYLTKQIVKVKQVIEKSKGPLTPAVTALFKAITDEASFYKIGRPPKKRKKSANELSSQKMTSGGKLSRIGKTMTCDTCKNLVITKDHVKGCGRVSTITNVCCNSNSISSFYCKRSINVCCNSNSISSFCYKRSIKVCCNSTLILKVCCNSKHITKEVGGKSKIIIKINFNTKSFTEVCCKCQGIMPPRRLKKKSVKRLVEKRVAKAIEEYEKTRANLDNAVSSGGNSENAAGTVNGAEEDKVMFTASTFEGRTLTWWNENVYTLGLINANLIPWSEFKTMITTEYFPAAEIQRMEQELWTLTLKGDDIEGRAARIIKSNKRKWEDQQGNNHHQQQNQRQEAAKAYVAAPDKGRGYVRNLPWCNRCKAHHQPSMYPPREKGHYRDKCPRGRNSQNEGPRGGAYAMRTEESSKIRM